MRQLVDQLWPTVLEKLRSDPEVSKHVSGWLADHIWSALAYALREHHDRHALPEIEGGDKGDGWRLVPIKMTADMINAWSGGQTVTTDEIAYRTTFQEAWGRVLAAAPSASIEGETP